MRFRLWATRYSVAFSLCLNLGVILFSDGQVGGKELIFSKTRGAVAFVGTLCLLAMPITPNAGGSSAIAATPHASTVSFLSNSFVGGKAIETANSSGNAIGATDFELSLEAMLQLKAGGRTFIQQLPAIRHLLSTRTQAFGTLSRGYLFNQDLSKSLKLSATGKFLFVSEAINVPNNSIRFEAFRKLATEINSKTGEIMAARRNAIDYSWVSMGLNSFQEFTLANRVVQHLLLLQNADGGFSEVDGGASSAHATGLALQAINFRQTFGTAVEDKKRVDAERKAVSYLLRTDIDESHWSAEGQPSVVATANAVMGLKSYGAFATTISRSTNWLKKQVHPKGGVIDISASPEPSISTTALSFAGMLGKSYLELLP